jgi:hypothetical protein
MALTQEQLNIVKQMKQAGATNAEIAGAMGRAKMGIVQPAPTPTIVDRREKVGISNDFGQDVGQTFAGIFDSIKGTYGKQMEAVKATQRGEQTPLRAAGQIAGIGLGGASDVVGEVVKGGVKSVLTQEQEDKTKETIEDVVSPIMQSESVKYLMGKYDSLSDKQKRDLDAITGTAEFGVDFLTGGIGAKVLKAGKDKIVKEAVKIKNFIPEEVVFKNADEVIDFVKLETPDVVDDVAEEATKDIKLSFQEKMIGLDPSYKKKIQGNPDKMAEYINVVKSRNEDLDLPSVYEYAGDNARLAVADMERILNSTGSEIGKTRLKLGSYAFDSDQVKNIENTFKSQAEKLNLRLVEGRLFQDSGKVSKVSNSELKTLQDLYQNIVVLKRSPNLTNGIDVRNVFDNKINFGKSAREISNNLDNISKETRTAIAKEAAKLVGKTEATKLEDYSNFMRAYEDLKGFTDRNAGGEYMLRVLLSGRGGDARKVVQTIADYTGKDLSVDAVMMTLVTDLMANGTQKNLFRQEIAKAGLDVTRILAGDKTAVLPFLMDFAKDKLIDTEKVLKEAAGAPKKNLVWQTK